MTPQIYPDGLLVIRWHFVAAMLPLPREADLVIYLPIVEAIVRLANALSAGRWLSHSPWAGAT
ncbi:MAG: hypothetical protein WCA35_21920 [Kovacikia sp.]